MAIMIAFERCRARLLWMLIRVIVNVRIEIWIVLHFFCSDDGHFKTNPKVPGIDLNSVRLLFEMLMKPAYSRLLEQVHKHVYHHTHSTLHYTHNETQLLYVCCCEQLMNMVHWFYFYACNIFGCKDKILECCLFFTAFFSNLPGRLAGDRFWESLFESQGVLRIFSSSVWPDESSWLKAAY